MYLLEIDQMDSCDFTRDLDAKSFLCTESDEILDLESPSLFTGDTIFTGGVGNVLHC